MRKVKDLFLKMTYILNKPQKLLCMLVFLLTCIGALLECLGVSIIVPLVNVIISPDNLSQSKWLSKIEFMQKLDYQGSVAVIIGLVVFVYIFKNSFFIFLSWIRIKFSCKIQRETSIRMMESYMSRGYQFFLNTSYGELCRGVSGDIDSVYNTLFAGFRLLSDFLAILLICIFMFYTDWQLSIAVVFMSGICILLIYFVFRRNMYLSGEKIRKYSAKADQAILQAFQGVKDVLVLRKQKFFVNEYEKNQIQVQLAQCERTMGAEAPAYVIEGICVSGIMVVVGMKIITGGYADSFFATLAAFAVGAFRVLPSLGRISISLNQTLTNIPSINAVYKDIKEAEEYAVNHPEVIFSSTDEHVNKIQGNVFEDKIVLSDISYAYNDFSPLIFENANLIIRKGQSIGIVGTSGAGKSTLVDILLGLLLCQKGNISIDGKAITDIPDLWSRMVGYIPQTIFLTDGSIKENVAFGDDQEYVKNEDVIHALEKAELSEFITSLPDGINTMVGERGVRLSGGQRQRIAIARALYHNPEILILDEATSALDNDTESAIMSAINSLQGTVTMIIIAHRLSTIRNCDAIYEVKNEKIIPMKKEDIFK